MRKPDTLMRSISTSRPADPPHRGRSPSRPRPADKPGGSSSSASTASTRRSSRRCSRPGGSRISPRSRRAARYSPLTPTVPAQTPVSWSTFSTGLDPGGHEIFDFLKRDPDDRVPTFAVARGDLGAVSLRRSPTRSSSAWRSPPSFSSMGGAVVPRSAAACCLMIVFDVLGLAAGAGALPRGAAWLPSERPGVQQQPPRDDVLVGAGRAAGDRDARCPVTFPPEQLRGRPAALGARASPTSPAASASRSTSRRIPSSRLARATTSPSRS